METFNLYDKEIQEKGWLPYKEAVISFCNELCGVNIKIKEIHLATSSQATHALCDQIHWTFANKFDALMENILGITYSKLPYGSLKPVIPSSNDLTEVLKYIKMKAMDFKKMMNMPLCNTLATITDELLEDIHKFIYLSVNR